MTRPAKDDSTASSRELDEAYARGVFETALALTEIVDDCDRALAALADLGAPEAVCSGLERARERMVGEFEKLGFESLLPVEQEFDPLFHEAIASEPGEGQDNVIVRVHRRGWMQGGKLLRPALVTVRQGFPGVEDGDEEETAESVTAAGKVFEAPDSGAEIAFPRRRRRPHAGTDFFGGGQ